MTKKTLKDIKQGIKDLKEDKVTRVTEVDKFMDEFERGRKNHPVFYFFHDSYYRVKHFITGIPLKVRTFIQRGRRGYANSDIWNFDYYLARVIEEGVKKLKEWNTGLPTYEEGKSELEAINEWDCIQNHIIHTFHTAKRIADGELAYVCSKKWTKEKYDRAKKFCDEKKYEGFRPMTLKETREFERGFDVFKEWFFALWD